MHGHRNSDRQLSAPLKIMLYEMEIMITIRRLKRWSCNFFVNESGKLPGTTIRLPNPDNIPRPARFRVGFCRVRNLQVSMVPPPGPRGLRDQHMIQWQLLHGVGPFLCLNVIDEHRFVDEAE